MKIEEEYKQKTASTVYPSASSLCPQNRGCNGVSSAIILSPGDVTVVILPPET